MDGTVRPNGLSKIQIYINRPESTDRISHVNIYQTFIWIHSAPSSSVLSFSASERSVGQDKGFAYVYIFHLWSGQLI